MFSLICWAEIHFKSKTVLFAECWNKKVRTDEIKSPSMQFRHIGWCNFVRVMQFRQFIFYILYLCISPGALGFNLEKNVESWNFQGGYLNANLTPSRVPTALEKSLKFRSVSRSWKNHWIWWKVLEICKNENIMEKSLNFGSVAHGKIIEFWNRHSFD